MSSAGMGDGLQPGQGVNPKTTIDEPTITGHAVRAEYLQNNPPTIDFSSIKEVRDLNVGWMSSDGANIDAAGAYEKECKVAGVPADPDKLAEILGGAMVHYRMSTLKNGLKYVGIFRDADGTQIYSDTAYHGLISCNCGAIHDSPAVSTPDHVRGTDIGDGFHLSMTVSGHSSGYGSTSTCAEKEYTVGNSEVKVSYYLKPPTQGSGHFWLRYEGRDYEQRTHQVNVIGKGLEDRNERVCAKLTQVEFRGEPDKNVKIEVAVAINLANSTSNTEWDQVTFKFGQDGKIEEIVGLSATDKPNPEWTDVARLLAMKKGQHNWFEYSASDPKARLITQAVFGRDITKNSHQAARSLNSVMAAVVAGNILTPAMALGLVE